MSDPRLFLSLLSGILGGRLQQKQQNDQQNYQRQQAQDKADLDQQQAASEAAYKGAMARAAGQRADTGDDALGLRERLANQANETRQQAALVQALTQLLKNNQGVPLSGIQPLIGVQAAALGRRNPMQIGAPATTAATAVTPPATPGVLAPDAQGMDAGRSFDTGQPSAALATPDAGPVVPIPPALAAKIAQAQAAAALSGKRGEYVGAQMDADIPGAQARNLRASAGYKELQTEKLPSIVNSQNLSRDRQGRAALVGVGVRKDTLKETGRHNQAMEGQTERRLSQDDTRLELERSRITNQTTAQELARQGKSHEAAQTLRQSQQGYRNEIARIKSELTAGTSGRVDAEGTPTQLTESERVAKQQLIDAYTAEMGRIESQVQSLIPRAGGGKPAPAKRRAIDPTTGLPFGMPLPDPSRLPSDTIKGLPADSSGGVQMAPAPSGGTRLKGVQKGKARKVSVSGRSFTITEI